jgi:hypothetical protein
MFAEDIIELISEFDFGIMCSLHRSGKKIATRNCTYELSVYVSKYDYVDILQYIFDRTTIGENKMYIEKLLLISVEYYSVNTFKYLYNTYKKHIEEDIIYKLFVSSIREKIHEIIYFFVYETEVQIKDDIIIEMTISNDITIQKLIYI